MASLTPAQNASVTLLGAKEHLQWEKQGIDLVILIPESLQKAPPCQNAWTIQISALAK